MPQELHLIPAPRSLENEPGTFALPPEMFIVLQEHAAADHLFPAERFILDAEPLSGSHFSLAKGGGVFAEKEIRVKQDEYLAPDLPEDTRNQAYRLSITPIGIVISAVAAPGIFYAFQTLLQILRQTAFENVKRKTQNAKQKIKSNRKSKIENRKSAALLALPCVEIFDYPDFARRGFYHDTARGKVSTVDTLLELIDQLGHLKYNEFQLYVENNFQFRRFPEMYDDTDPLTAEELLLLDAACRIRHIDFVPSLTSLGHFERILNRPRFRHLAEAEPEQLKAIGATCWHEAGPWSLCVTDPEARQFLKDMYGEFSPNFSSGRFNICCDEAYDLGAVRSKIEAEKRGGTGPLYVEWIDYCAGLARTHGKSIQMWGDIILNHPELISQLPPDATLLEWGYEHNHKFDEHCQVFAERLKENAAPAEQDIKTNSEKKSERGFYVSPGTSSWLTLSSRSKNAFGNIHNAATAGLKYGAEGLLLTDWGDNGHQQPLAVSLCAIAYGAVASWNLAAVENPATETQRAKRKTQNKKLTIKSQKSKIKNLLRAASLHLFGDPTGRIGQMAYDLGLVYEVFSWQRFNGSVDWFLFREKWDFANYVNRAEPADLPRVIAFCEKLSRNIQSMRLTEPDGKKIIEELLFTAQLIIHTCRRTALRQAWLAVDPMKRNPEHEILRAKPPRPLPKTFPRDMRKLAAEARTLKSRFKKIWLARNKPSRLADVLTEFDRLLAEYRQFANAQTAGPKRRP